jgi:RNA polymerase subunit RPABC4/transcription elongation factor Spt4
MKANYCPECGGRLLKGDVFCGECGTKIIQEEAIVEIPLNHCSVCEYSTIEDEKFCPNCGSPMHKTVDSVSISDDFPSQITEVGQGAPANKSQEKSPKGKSEVLHKPIRKKKSIKPVIIAKRSTGRKKGGFLRLAGKLILGVMVVMIIGSVVLYNLEKKEWERNQWENNEYVDNQKEVPEEYTEEKPSTPPERNTTSKPVISKTANINQVANQVEQIFQDADTTALKQILTETSLTTYAGIFSSIQPYMKDYGKAFKNRNLEVNTTVYSLYSFKDKDGEEFTVEFSKLEDGVWKLVRF